jgi:hypothetical protein
MGNFYANVTLRASSVDDVIEYLRSNGFVAFVSPAADDGSVVVYERRSDEQDVDALDALAAGLSVRFESPTLAALVHDDDVLPTTPVRFCIPVSRRCAEPSEWTRRSSRSG